MKITDERLVEILNDNFNILILSDDSGKINISVISESENNIHNVEVLVHDVNFEESYFLLEVDTTHYDEKFSDVNKYETEDMGVLIQLQVAEDLEEFNETNMWRSLYYNK